MPEDPRCTRTRTTFRLAYEVSIDIDAQPARVWSLLTTAADFPNWNTTVQSIEGDIAEGQTIKLVAKSAPDRTFKLKVREVQPEKRMVWRDGMAPMFKGVRTFTLESQPGGKTHFTMGEVFSGIMLPMIAGQLPDFVPVFEQYAKDLRAAAES